MDTGDTPEEADTPESVVEAPVVRKVSVESVVVDAPAAPVVHGYNQDTGEFRP